MWFLPSLIPKLPYSAQPHSQAPLLSKDFFVMFGEHGSGVIK